MMRISFAILLIAAICWSILLLYLHFLPAKELNLEGWYLKYHIDKVAHLVMFTVLFISWYLSLRKKNSYKKSLIIAIIIVVAYGAVLEILQGTVVVGRTSDIADFIADIASIPIALLAIKVFSWE